MSKMDTVFLLCIGFVVGTIVGAIGGTWAVLTVWKARKPKKQATYHALEDATDTVTQVLKGEKL
jgi:hypothetical protein